MGLMNRGSSVAPVLERLFVVQCFKGQMETCTSLSAENRGGYSTPGSLSLASSDRLFDVNYCNMVPSRMGTECARVEMWAIFLFNDPLVLTYAI